MDRPTRNKLPGTRQSVTHHVEIHAESGKVDIYLIAGLYPDGRPGELFIKEGLSQEPLADQWARSVSILLQSGYTTRDLCHWHAYTKFEPRGYTSNPDINTAHSIVDYAVRWLDLQFGKLYEVFPIGNNVD